MEGLHGLGANRERSDDDNEDGHGTCMASKVSSRNFGVLPSGPVFTIVKIDPTIASSIDAFGAILADIRAKGPSVQGRAVIQITGNWALLVHEAYILQIMRDGINSLFSSKIMVIYPTAWGEPGDKQIDTWPSSLAGITDMITVGAVTPTPGSVTPVRSKKSMVAIRGSRNRYCECPRCWIMQGHRW